MTMIGTVLFVVAGLNAATMAADFPCRIGQREHHIDNNPPKCRPSGLFEVKQCETPTPYCYCVDQMTGQQLGATKTNIDCTKHAYTCHRAKTAVMEVLDGRLLGAFVPQCHPRDEDRYNAEQYYGSTGSSWCVNQVSGQEIPGTHLIRGERRTVPCGGLMDAAPPRFPCRAQRAHEQSGQLMLGRFVAQCRQSGLFKLHQCDQSTGHCWCVNQVTGEKINGTETAAGRALADCSAHALTCIEEKDAVEAAFGERNFVGAFVPQCEGQTYKAEQFYGSTGYSWCVNQTTGVEIANTRLAPGLQRLVLCDVEAATAGFTCREQQVPNWGFTPKCKPSGLYEVKQCNNETGTCYCADEKTGVRVDHLFQPIELPDVNCTGYAYTCHHAKQTVMELLDGRVLGAFVPQCDPQNEDKYEAEQYDASTGSKWCVNPATGVEIPGTHLIRGESRHIPCERLMMDAAPPMFPCRAQRAHEQAGKLMLGRFVAQCRQSGLFKLRQCDQSTGNCWCANEVTGEKIKGTETAAGQALADCSAHALSCKEEKDALEASFGQMPIVGAFVPQCEGEQYKAEQFYGSTGFSWCVDPLTGVKISNTDVAPGHNRTVPCPTRAAEASISCWKLQSINEVLLGAFVPKCRPSGLYAVKQCSGRAGFTSCSCVDEKTGVQVYPSPIVPLELSDVNCAKYAYTCRRAKQAVMELLDGRVMGAFVPQCDPKNEDRYKAEQYYASTGSSWCVNDVTGEERPGSHRTRTEKRAIPCEQQLLGDVIPVSLPCREQRASGLSRKFMIGAYQPQCTLTGIYELHQCHRSTGRCWCVNQLTGKKIEGTMTEAGQALANCTDHALTCREELAVVDDALRQSGIVGAFIPRCQGRNYQAEQSWGSTGYSWCVVPRTGQKIANTDLPPGDKRAVPCSTEAKGAYGLLCMTTNQAPQNPKFPPGLEPGPVIFSPECTNSGLYKAEQCVGADCVCVDQVTGKAIEGTEGTKANCSGHALDCPQEAAAVTTLAGPTGFYVPECEGRDFKRSQLFPLTGMSWCVNAKTGEEIPGTRKRTDVHVNCDGVTDVMSGSSSSPLASLTFTLGLVLAGVVTWSG